jgi:hypothetical protein
MIEEFKKDIVKEIQFNQQRIISDVEKTVNALIDEEDK